MANQEFTPSKEYLNEFLEYRDGELFWKKKHSRTVIIGNKVGNMDSKGYLRMCINYKEFRLHRIIFLMHHGYLPEFIDHIDGNKTNNRIGNLRPATKSENAKNTQLNAKNKSGFKNVSWSKSANKWAVQMSIDGKNTNCGLFDDINDASKEAERLRKIYHGVFAI